MYLIHVFQHDRFYSWDLELFTKAIQTQLLVAQESCDVFSEINDQLLILRERMSLSVDSLESDKAAEIEEILRLFTKWCHLDDEDEPHTQNQKILYNSGNLGICMTLFYVYSLVSFTQ